MVTKTVLGRPGTLILSISSLCLSAVVMADSGTIALEEVIVTAQKREQSLQSAPISILAFDNQALQNMGATGIGDITNSIPNMTQITFSVGNSTLRLYMRGVGQTDSQLTGDSPVGVYLDGVYLARTSGLATSLPDIQRIEVLRGPQGTLFGRNTTGGAISIVTNPADYDRLTFSQQLRLGNYGALKSTTVLNVPVTDELAFRASYIFDERDGTVENTGIGNDFNEWQNKAMRLAGRWSPTEALEIAYNYDRTRYTATADLLYLDKVNASFAGILPEQKGRVSRASLPEPFRDSHTNTEGHALTVTYDTDIGQLKSISSYRTLDFDAYQDQSANPDIEIFRNEYLENEHEQLSQELQLVGDTQSGSLSYVLGVYYFKESGEEHASDEIGLFNLDTPRHITAKNTAYAAYTSWKWTPGGNSDWSYTLGGRYSKDKREANNHLIDPVSASYGKFTPSLVVDYRINDSASLYGKVETGYNAGGFNMRAADFSNDFGPESLVAYELGWKTELLDRRLRFNGALFYSDYTDIQFTIQAPGQSDPANTQTLNAGKEEIYGAELDITYLFAPSLVGTLSYGYLDGKFKKGAPGDDVSLYRLANAPENTIRATMDWTITSIFGGDVALYLSYYARSKTYTTPRDPSPGDDSIPGYGLLDARLSWNKEAGHRAGAGYTLALWGKNLADKEYFVDSASVFQGLHANRVVRYGDPFTFGIELEYRY